MHSAMPLCVSTKLARAEPAKVPKIVITGRNASLGFSERKFFMDCGSLPMLSPTVNISVHKA